MFRLFWITYLSAVALAAILLGNYASSKIERPIEHRKLYNECVDDFVGFEQYELEVNNMCSDGVDYILNGE